MNIIKKDGTLEKFKAGKIKTAVKKAAFRCDRCIDDDKLSAMAETVKNRLTEENTPVLQIHELVIATLSSFGFKDVADSYAEYRYYKTSYAKNFEKLKSYADDILYRGDRENANFDSALISTKGSLLRGYLAKSLYQQFYLSKTEKELCKRGDIYIHDMRDMIFGSVNCLDGSTWVTIRQNGDIATITLSDLRERLNVTEGVFALSRGIQILSRNGWVALEGISVRKLEENEAIYHIRSANGLAIKATANHLIPVLDNAGQEKVKNVKDIEEGDSLISVGEVALSESNDLIDLCDYADHDKAVVGGMQYLKRYFEYKYGQSLQAYCRLNGIETDKNIRSLKLKEFLKIKKLIQIPYDVYAKLTIYRNGSTVKLPLLLPVSNELARMFGYIFADGCVAKNNDSGCYQVVFSSTKIPLLADYVVSAETVFPDVHIVRRDPVATSTTPCTAVTLCNAVVWDFFRAFKQGAGNIEIPDCIMNGSAELKYNFIVAAMDCDGHYGATQFRYATASEKYAEQFVMLLQSLGYHPTLSCAKVKGTTYVAKDVVGTRNYNIYNVTLSQYEDQTRFVQITDELRKSDVNLKERKAVPHNSCKIVKITEEYPTNTYVYDLQTQDHWFVANGYVVHNCCLGDFANVMKGGFEAANIRYTEPKTVNTAINLLGDLVLMTSPMQFGGMTVPEIDKILLPYCKKTLAKARVEISNYTSEKDKINEYAWAQLYTELRQGFQALELKLNSIASARGDYPFSTISFGSWNSIDDRTEEDDKILEAICKAILDQRIKGHGGLPVVFPKLIYLWDESLVGNNKRAESVFNACVECCAKRQYPDMISLTGDPENNDIARQFRDSKGKCVISAMGCRAFLSPWKNEKGELVAVGRCNIGVVSMNIPLLVAIAKKEYPNNFREAFWEILANRMDVVRDFLRKRYDTIAKTPASTNPIMFTQGGFYNGYRKPDDPIGDLINYMTASFGYIGLNEATILWEGETIRQDRSFGLRVLRFIADRIEKYKKEDGHLYAFYSTPAESYQGTAAKQYEAYTHDKRFGDYFTNSFHMRVDEDITPFEKQDLEEPLFKIPAGGRIQYVRVDNPENIEAVRALLIRGLKKGFYQGINFDQVFCNDCGKESTNSLNKCPHCGSTNINVISRVTGYLGYTKVNGGSRMNDALLANVHDRKSM